jgi:hypothetical protein
LSINLKNLSWPEVGSWGNFPLMTVEGFDPGCLYLLIIANLGFNG